MTYQSQRRDQQTLSLLAIDHMPECPGCQELCPAGATVCAECGTHLFVRNSNGPGRSDLDGTSAAGAEEVIVMEAPNGCTCGGRDLCTACALASFERDPFVESTSRALRILDGHGNVIALDRYSKKVTS